MKRETILKVSVVGDSDDDSLTDQSAETVLQRELAELGTALAVQGVDLLSDNAYANADGRDRLYWQLGYFIGLKYGLAMLTSQGATVH